MICYLLSIKQFNKIIFPVTIERVKITLSLVIVKEGIFLTLISTIIQIYSTILYFFIKQYDVNLIKEADVSLMLSSFVLIFYSLTSLLTSVNPEILKNLDFFLKKFLAPTTLSSFIITALILAVINLKHPFTRIFEILTPIIFSINYWDLVPLLTIALLGVPFHTIYMIIMGYFVGNDQSKLQFFFNLISFILSLPIIFILSYNYGAWGSLFSYMLFSAFLAFFSVLGLFFQDKISVLNFFNSFLKKFA
jgi:hypothetical protein